IWAAQNVKLVIKGGEQIDTTFHADHKNPIPGVRPWRATPREIRLNPKKIVQGAGPTMLKVTANGFLRSNKVQLNGKELETRFVSKTELQAIIPPELVADAGTYTLGVVSPGDFTSRSGPAYLIVSFKK